MSRYINHLLYCLSPFLIFIVVFWRLLLLFSPCYRLSPTPAWPEPDPLSESHLFEWTAKTVPLAFSSSLTEHASFWKTEKKKKKVMNTFPLKQPFQEYWKLRNKDFDTIHSDHRKNVSFFQLHIQLFTLDCRRKEMGIPSMLLNISNILRHGEISLIDWKCDSCCLIPIV